MLIGSLNNPSKDLLKEIKWISRNFDFIDLTLELPKAHPDIIKVGEVKKLIDRKRLPVVGHTAWYLPIGSPFKELRMYAISELEKCAGVFHKLGAEKFNVHFDDSIPMLKENHTIDFNIWTIRRLISLAKKYDMKVMAENTPGIFSNPATLDYVFRKAPGLLLHLDIAHANIAPKNLTHGILRRLSDKLSHVHASGNYGKRDEHLPIGKGNIKWSSVLGAVKLTGYDSTISLEVFTSPEDRIRDKKRLRQIWDNLGD